MGRVRKKGWFYIPMDVKNRELYGKLLLALFSAENGFHVIIGQENSLHRCLSYMPKGVYMHYGVSQQHVNALTESQSSGHINVALDEEGLAIYCPDMYLRYRISSEALELVEKFYAWGNFHSNLILPKFHDRKGKVIETGNPRFDLLRNDFVNIFQGDAARIIDKFGNFILINTNFASSNHFKGPDFGMNLLKSRGLIRCENDEIFHTQRLEHQKRIIKYFIDMIHEISNAFPEYEIIVRPHPSENQQFWKKISMGLKNVTVVHEGNIIPWLLAAKIVIHNGCTTAIESFLIRTPAIAFCPIVSEKFDNYLPNALSYIVSDIPGLKELITKLLSGEKNEALIDDPKRRSIAEAHISSIEGEFACERIVDSIEPLLENQKTNRIRLGDRFVPLFIRLYLLFLDTIQKEQNNKKYIEHKFEELEFSEVLEPIRHFKAVSGRFISVKATKLGKNLYYIRCVD